jgi:hypothetical protein
MEAGAEAIATLSTMTIASKVDFSGRPVPNVALIDASVLDFVGWGAPGLSAFGARLVRREKTS